jgi:hypothetical protein
MFGPKPMLTEQESIDLVDYHLGRNTTGRLAQPNFTLNFPFVDPVEESARRE